MVQSKLDKMRDTCYNVKMNAEHPFETCKLYGPYVNNTRHRRFVRLQTTNGVARTMPYARYLMCVHLGRELTSNEVVHHIDGDSMHDELANFVVLTQAAHHAEHIESERESARRMNAKRIPQYADTEVNCVECNTPFVLSADQMRKRAYTKRAGLGGPYCSMQCSGKHAARNRWTQE